MMISILPLHLSCHCCQDGNAIFAQEEQVVVQHLLYLLSLLWFDLPMWLQ